MRDWKMIDADGHIREVESDVFEYLPDYYKARREAVLYFPLLPHHGWHRQAGRAGIGASFMIPTLDDWRQALDQGDIEAAVVYPTRFMHIGQVGMADFAVDLSRAYNEFLQDRFLRHDSSTGACKVGSCSCGLLLMGIVRPSPGDPRCAPSLSWLSSFS